MSERLYTAEEVARLQESEVKAVLKGLLHNLEDVLAQRTAGHHRRVTPVAYARREGEIWGLKLTIQAVKRRIR